MEAKLFQFKHLSFANHQFVPDDRIDIIRNSRSIEADCLSRSAAFLRWRSKNLPYTIVSRSKDPPYTTVSFRILSDVAISQDKPRMPASQSRSRGVRAANEQCSEAETTETSAIRDENEQVLVTHVLVENTNFSLELVWEFKMYFAFDRARRLSWLSSRDMLLLDLHSNWSN